MTMNKKGFTLIELLVVIAIIGVLASVVLASLNTARDKGKDAAIKANLANIRAQAELYYDTNGNNYGDGVGTTAVACPTTGTSLFAGDSVVKNAIAATDLQSPGTPQCSTDTAAGTVAQKWAISSTLAAGSPFWCVDSSGSAGTTTSAGDVGTCN